MACRCCTSYCHAPNPCLADIRIKATWGNIQFVSSRVNNAEGTANECPALFNGTLSGIGRSVLGLGQCVDQGTGITYTVEAQVNLGVSQNAFGNWAFGSCCTRTGLRTAKIFGGKVQVLVWKGTLFNFRQSRGYDFSFASLDAQAVVTPNNINESVGDPTPCDAALIGNLVTTQPQLELVVTSFPTDFCNPFNALTDGKTGVTYAAVGGPFLNVDCPSQCPNPLP